MFGQTARARLEPSGWQVIDVVVDGAYRPSTIIARAGRPLRLRFRRDDADECTDRVIFSAPRFDRRLALGGTTTIELPAQPPGEVRFTCAMGRYRGRIDFVHERSSSLLGTLRDRLSRLET